MPTFHDPAADADEAREALRALAHATRSFDHPAETYSVIGELLSGVRSLRQVLDQLAAAHLNHRAWARTDEGDRATGAAQATAAADELRDAAAFLDHAQAHLDRASQHSGRVAWQPPDPPTRERRWASNERAAGWVGPSAPVTRDTAFDPGRGLGR
ncbi:hypothetical protein [Candidatus Corynebacterium faecigallinarum]|uniref:hypothetical protein n=1 Tax=Candidatus Corynebacterium faecigallinarum TaxID=2838528 RepID=UPI003FB741AB